MPDTLILNVGGIELRHFLSFEVDADMYNAASAFALDVANPDVSVLEGQSCQLKVNGQKVLNGYIDIVDSSGEKGSHSLKLYGRDLMGVLVEWKLTTSTPIDISGMQIFAQKLLKMVPVINLKSVSYAKGVFNKQAIANAQPFYTEIGQTIFEVLSKFAREHGLLFWCNPDGSFVFGTPLTAGAPTYRLTLRRDGIGNNVKHWKVRKDISKRYATTCVVNAPFIGKNNVIVESTSVTVTDKTYPSWAIKKPYVTTSATTAEYLSFFADSLITEQRHQGFTAEYTVKGFSQAGKLWNINKIVTVDDDVNGLHGNFLITGRTFVLSKKEGSVTKIRLSLLGAKS